MSASSLLWKLNRLRAMSSAEFAYRVRHAVQGRLERHLGWGLASDASPQGVSGPAWVSALPRAIDPAPYVDGADAVLSGRFRLFALGEATIGFPPRWNRDPKTGTDVPLEFGKGIDYRDERIVGDIKYLWEPNRHLELVTLAQAWHLTGESRFLEGIRLLLDSWFEQCPYPLGPNWTSSLEHGIRLVNWAFAWQFLGADTSPIFDGPKGAAFKGRWLRSVRQHCHFIAGHVSRYSSANNHVLGEMMGLFVGSTTWPLWPESRRWRDTAYREFAGQAMLQTGTDGVNREQAIYYQHEVMDMMLVCGLVARANGLEFEGEYWKRLERMTEFLAALMDRSGHVPMIGDADDARVIGLTPARRGDPYRSLLASGAVLFGRVDFKRQAGACDDKTVWLLGDSARQAFNSLPKSDCPGLPTAFREGGYYLLSARRGEPDEILACVDCGPIGYPSIAAHGHADALSMTVTAAGTPLLVDPGTYAYHTQKTWRDYFRSTFAHNTVCVDHLDQSVIGGNFLWLQKAAARCLSFDPDGARQRFLGEHNGYSRLSDPVIHRRSIDFDPAGNEFIVEDTIECRASHDIEVCWHFSDRCEVAVCGTRVYAKAGGVRLSVSPGEGAPAPRVICGQTNPPGGWISYSYDTKTPISTVVWSYPVQGSTRLETILRIEFSEES